METEAEKAVLTRIFKQLSTRTSIETEFAFLEYLSRAPCTSERIVSCSEKNASAMHVLITPCADDSHLLTEDTIHNQTQHSGNNEVREKGLKSYVLNGSCHEVENLETQVSNASFDQESKANDLKTSLSRDIDVKMNSDSSKFLTEAQLISPVSHAIDQPSVFQQNNMPGLNELCHDPLLVMDLVEYAFWRRYGAADKQMQDETVESVGQIEPGDRQTEERLFEKIDVVIHRIVEQPVTAQMAAAFENLLIKAADMPTLRYKTINHVMVWLSGTANSKMDDNTYRAIKSLVLTGVTDVWSAVRKACSTGIPVVFRVWSCQQQQDFFSSVLEMCIHNEGSWQSKDGAALCVSAVMNNCYIAGVDQDKALRELPGFVVECVLTIVFSLISHPQLSIRETVARIMSAYMQHVDSQDMVDLLHQTLTLLTPSTREEFQCVDAYAAEGLLNICISIFKVLPVKQAVILWPSYRNTLLSYLTHSASSVRQASSTLFMCLASKREASAVLIKVVLHHLVKGWTLDAEPLSSCTGFLEGVNDGLDSWEAREGRMFVYELLCKHLIDNHLELMQTSSRLSVVSSPENSVTVVTDSCMREVYIAVEQHLRVLSSLKQLGVLDNPRLLANNLGIQVWSESQHQCLQRWLLAHYASLRDGCVEVWWEEEESLPTFRHLLLTMLQHTALCLANAQWELRRIAQQMLPHLFEVMCLYHVDLIMTVWHYVTEDANLWSFLGLYALRESLSHCARVVATADLSDKASALKDSAYIELVDCVRKHVEDYLPLVSSHLRRPVFDKLSIIAAEVAMLAVNFFDLQEDMKQDLCQAVLVLWSSLFSFAHPNSAISTSLFDSPTVEFAAPYEGFLSCCLVRPETKLQCARQVEKSMVSAVYRHLPHFLPQLDCHNAALCLPILAHNLGLFVDNTEVCRALINSFSILCQCTSMSVAAEVEDETDNKVHRCVYFTLRELAAVIAMKSLDTVLLQKVLGCYVILCRLLNPAFHLPLLLRGVCARMNEGQGFHLESVVGPDLGMDLRWHKAELPILNGGDHHRVSRVSECSTLDSSLGHEQSEAESLNQSGSSYGTRLCPRMGRRRTLSISGDALLIHEVASGLEEGDDAGEESRDSESDWDSWSEEENEEEMNVLRSHFQEFFHQIQSVYGSDCYSLLDTERQRLTRKEQDLLLTLIS